MQGSRTQGWGEPLLLRSNSRKWAAPRADVKELTEEWQEGVAAVEMQVLLWPRRGWRG